MTLFSKLAERFRTQNREAKAAETVAKKGPQPFIKRWVVQVPKGYALPLETPVENPFNLTVEAGVRWHPEWTEPRITVNLFRVFPFGDALSWSGQSALNFKALLDPSVAVLADYHGQTMGEGSEVDREIKALAIKTLGLTIPKVQQPLSAFNTFREGPTA